MVDSRGHERAVVSDPGHDCGPAFSPDGKRLVWASNRDAGPTDPYNLEIYVMDVRSGRTRRLTNYRGFDTTPAWSPDGKWIAFERELEEGTQNSGSRTIWKIRPDGSGLRQVTPSNPLQDRGFPAWSPDGKTIAFTAFDDLDYTDASIYTIDPDGKNLRLLTDDGGYPSWSPDGKRIVFSGFSHEPKGEPDLYVMNANGSHRRRLFKAPGADYYPSWSPDGRHIVYAHDPDAYVVELVFWAPITRSATVEVSGPAPSEIWVADVNTGRARQLLPSGGSTDPKFVPTSP
jgi:TolB protein